MPDQQQSERHSQNGKGKVKDLEPKKDPKGGNQRAPAESDQAANTEGMGFMKKLQQRPTSD